MPSPSDNKTSLASVVILLMLIGIFIVLVTNCAHNLYLRSDTGQNTRQCILPVLVGITQGTPEPLADAIRSAMTYWNSTSTRKYFTSLGVVPWGTDDPHTGGFVPIQIVPANDLWGVDTSACAAARIRFNPTSGCIRTAKIRVSDKCTGPIEVFETSVRHELGHVLGLKDNSISFTALMNPTVSRPAQHPLSANEQELKALWEMYQ